MTVNEKDVVLVKPPPVPLTVMENVPVAALVVVFNVMVLVQVELGVQLVGEKDAVTPEGNVTALRFTDCAAALVVFVTVIVFVTELPFVTLLFPPLLREKSNDGVNDVNKFFLIQPNVWSLGSVSPKSTNHHSTPALSITGMD